MTEPSLVSQLLGAVTFLGAVAFCGWLAWALCHVADQRDKNSHR